MEGKNTKDRAFKNSKAVPTVSLHFDLSTQPSFQRGFKGGLFIKSFRKYNPWTA